jgi:hypothetical protein
MAERVMSVMIVMPARVMLVMPGSPLCLENP